MTCPFFITEIEFTHSIKHDSNSSLSIAENTRLIVSYEGIPFSRVRNFLKNSYFVIANILIYNHVSAPQNTENVPIEGCQLYYEVCLHGF